MVNWQNPNLYFLNKSGYRIPLVIAISLHLVLLGLLISSVWWSKPTEFQAPSQAIQATLINSSTLAAMQRAAAPAVKPPSPTPKKVEPIKPVPQPPQPKPEPKITSKDAVKTQPVVKPQPVAKPQKTVDQQKLLEQSLAQELSDQKPAKKTPSKDQQKLLEQQLAAEMAGDTKSEKQAAMSAKTQGEVDEYKGKILQQIQQNWIVPQNVKDLTCLLQVDVAPGGMVMKVTVLKSSGNDALDRSAIAAVNKASPLPVPKDPLAFNAFRTFTITVKPEGASDIN